MPPGRHDARDALSRQLPFLTEVAGDPNAPRAERLAAIELLARLAELESPPPPPPPGAAKHASKHASKHATKHASKHASKHATKHATKRVEGGREPKRLGDGGARRALPPGRG
jgi:hypothetical protein